MGSKLIFYGLHGLFFWCLSTGKACAAAEEGGYLASYQDTAAAPAAASGWSMLAYVLSLLIVFAFIAVLAYMVSRFVGGKFSSLQGGTAGRVVENVSLGANRSVCAVDIAGKVILVGVTEQQVTFLSEVTDELEIARLRNQEAAVLANGSFEQIFEKQIESLNRLSKTIPTLLNEKRNRGEEKR